MRANYRLASAAALFLPLLLSGCSLFPTTRKLPVPKAPVITQTATPEQLVARLNERWAAISTLTAKVEFQASVAKSKEGVATDYPSIEGHILLRKPSDLRVLGRYFGVLAFDMSSDGKNFSLSVPTKNKFIRGSNSLKKKSLNTWENLRPGFFVDALLVRGLDPDDWYSVVIDSETLEDAARKHLFTVPEYILSISRRKPATQELIPVRVVTFRRDNLLPYQQDIYDSEGHLETHVTYSAYQDFEGSQYPSLVIIKRPIDEIQIVLTVDDVHENQPLADDQFLVKPADGAKVQNLE
jgi:outer membrane lipoprotein-sorting protein